MKLFVIRKATEDVIQEFIDDGVRLLELRSTPRSSPTKRDYLIAIIQAIDNIICKNATTLIDIGVLVSIDRRQTIDDVTDTCTIVLEMSKMATDL